MKNIKVIDERTRFLLSGAEYKSAVKAVVDNRMKYMKNKDVGVDGITQKLVKEVIEHNKLLFHDVVWHEFNYKKEVEAVNFALTFRDEPYDLKDIVREAKEYFATSWYCDE